MGITTSARRNGKTAATTGNRYGMGTAEQVLEFEAWLRDQSNTYLIACLCDGDEHPGLRAYAQHILNTRRVRS